MSTGDLRYWFFWLIGVIAAVGGVWIIRKSLFGDREAYVRRCPKCLHNLIGTPGFRCGECGRTAATEEELHFRIRHWRIAIMTISALVLGTLIVLGRASERGVPGLMPTKVLLWVLPHVGTTDSDVYDELTARMKLDELSATEWQMFIARAAEGDEDHPPASAPWERKYGDIIARGLGGSGYWRQLGLEADLLAIPARLDLETRPAWPKGAPVCVELSVRDWWPNGTQSRVNIIAHALDPAEKPIPQPIGAWQVLRGGRPLIQDSLPLKLPGLADDAAGVELEYRIERRHPEFDNEWTEIAHGSQRALFTRSDEIVTDALAAVASPAMDRAVERAFTGLATRWKIGTLRFVVRFDPWRTSRHFDDGVAIGVQVEVLYNGEPVRSSHVWWMASSGREQLGVELPEFHNPLLDTASLDPSRWSLRITSDPETALRVSGAQAYWWGAVEVPLTVEEAPGESPGFDWFVESIDPRDSGLLAP